MRLRTFGLLLGDMPLLVKGACAPLIRVYPPSKPLRLGRRPFTGLPLVYPSGRSCLEPTASLNGYPRVRGQLRWRVAEEPLEVAQRLYFLAEFLPRLVEIA